MCWFFEIVLGGTEKRGKGKAEIKKNREGKRTVTLGEGRCTERKTPKGGRTGEIQGKRRWLRNQGGGVGRPDLGPVSTPVKGVVGQKRDLSPRGLGRGNG